jgi:glycosyltransferase involved in cell wall biosynthesis
MRIGIDATALPLQPVGAGIYMINLVRALAAVNERDELVIFTHPAGRKQMAVQESKHFRWAVVPDKSIPRRLFWEQIGLPRLVGKMRLDLLHSLHYTRPWRLPCRSVVTFHDMTFFLYPQLHTRSKQAFFPLTIRASARSADAIIAVSESTRADSIRLLGIPGEKIIATPLGVDPAFRPIRDLESLDVVRQRYNLPDRFILYVGLVEPRKNLSGLIRAYRSALEGGIAHRLVVVGRFGWSYQQVLDEIEALGLQERVQFTGYIPQADLPIVYNLASLFVYPTLYEGFGLPALEAMACGTPVVTSNVASLPEIIGEAGVLIPPGDQQALSQALQDVLSDPGLQTHLAIKGPQQASQFTWERTARQTLQVYRQVLANSGKA